MNYRIQFLAITASIASATVPHAIQSGKPAIAQDVNENFVALDTAIQNRATKSDVAAKIDSGSVVKLLKGKADTASTTWIKAKADSAWVLDKLKGKLDASADATYLKVADTVFNATRLTLASSITDMIDGGPWYGIGRTALPSLAPNDATSAGLQIQLSGYYGLRLRSAQHVIDIPENAADGPVTIDGRQPLYYGGNLGATAFTDNNPPIGSWYSDPGSASVADAPNGSFNLQVFSTGSAGRGFQIAAPYDGDVVFFAGEKPAGNLGKPSPHKIGSPAITQSPPS